MTSRRRFLSALAVLGANVAIAACAGQEEAGGGGSRAGTTPRVVQNATPLSLGGSSDPAAVAATAAAQAAAGGAPPPASAPKPGTTPAPAKPGTAGPTSAPAAAPPKPGAAEPPKPNAPAPTQPAAQAKPAAQPTPAPPGTRVGIVQPSWETIHLNPAELGAQVKGVTNADMDEYARSIDQLIRGGSNMIITIGEDLMQATQDAAGKTPNDKFVGIDQLQEQVLPNCVGLVFADDQAGFIAGALAGLMTKSNTVGAVVGPGWMNTMINMGEGFAAGAEYVNPNVIAEVEYHPGDLPDGLHDQTFARDTANTMIGDGADVIFGVGGQTGQAALEAAKAKNVFVIGSEQDQYEVLPSVRPVLLTSVVKTVNSATINQLVKGFADGSVKGGNVYGEIAVASFREAEPKVPRQVRDRVDTIVKGLKQGSIKTGIQMQ